MPALAFEDKGNKLETRSNSEQIAASMVRIAEARGWDEIKVSGSETFRREVWLAAASRGMHVKGYTPSEQDKAQLAQRTRQLDANKVEKDNPPFRVRENGADNAKGQGTESDNPPTKAGERAKAFRRNTPEQAIKQHPELAGAYATVAALDKKAEADGLDQQQRAIVTARVREKIANSIERGDIPQTKIREERETNRDKNSEREYAR